MLKLNTMVAFVALAMTVNAMAENKEVRVETRSRVVGESLVGIGSCSAPEISSYNSVEPIVNQDGSISTDKNGNMRTQEVTVITATSNVELVKCRTTETYKSEVTGSFWNEDSKEISGTQERSGEVISQKVSKAKSLKVNMNKLGLAGRTISYGQTQFDVALTMADGLKAQALKECQSTAVMLKQAIVDVKQTNCR